MDTAGPEDIVIIQRVLAGDADATGSSFADTAADCVDFA